MNRQVFPITGTIVTKHSGEAFVRAIVVVGCASAIFAYVVSVFSVNDG